MSNVQSVEGRRHRKMQIRWQYLVPAALLFLGLSLSTTGCAPTPPVAPGTLNPSGIPDHQSPIYSNQPQLRVGLTHDSSSNDDRDTNVTVRLNCADSVGQSCADHVASEFTTPTKEQIQNHVVPFDIIVSRNGQDGILNITVATTECEAGSSTNCSSTEGLPFQVGFDTVPPQVDIDPNVPLGQVSGTVTDTGSPVTQVDLGLGADGGNTPLSVGPDGKFLVGFTPQVGANSITVSATDAAGNTTHKEASSQPYQINAQIQSMQINKKEVNLAALSQEAGIAINDGDIIVKADLPDGANTDSATLTAEQKNWSTLGFDFKTLSFKSTVVPCDRINQSGWDVAFSCTPATKSGNSVDMKFTFTDKYGYSYDLYYPDNASFPVETRPKNIAETAWFYTERALAILAAASAAGLFTALAVKSAKYQTVQRRVYESTLAGNVHEAFAVVNSASSLTNRQRNKLLSEINAEIEAKKREVLEAEQKHLVNKLYEFPMAYHDYTESQFIPHTNLKGAIENLNRVLQIGLNTTHLQDQAGRNDAEVITEKLKLALNRWLDLNIYIPGKESNYDWNAVLSKALSRQGEMEAVLGTLVDLQSKQEYSALWSQLKKGKEHEVKKMNEAALVFAYNSGALMKNGEMKQKTYTHLISHNMPIEDAISSLMKWGALGLGGFLEKIHDGGDRARAYKHFARFFNRQAL